MIIAVGRGCGPSQWPDQKEPVIDDIEGFGFVPKVMLSSHVGSGLLRWFFGRLGRIGIWPELVGTNVIDIGGLRIAPGGETAMLAAGRGIAGAAFLASLARRTGTHRGRL